MINQEWLEKINKEFRSQDVSPKGRPWLAIQKYGEEFKCSIAFSSPIAEEIFKWFENNSQPGAHQIGSLFTGAYYFDGCFWPVSIPVGFGTNALNALDSLHTMPEKLKEELMGDRRHAWGYTLYWADCLDYGYGIDDLSKTQGLDPFGVRLMKSGDAELNAAISQLCEFRPNTKAMMSSRMVVEMFLKAIIALKEGLTDDGARTLGHKLDVAMEKCVALTGDETLKAIRKELDIFPAIAERYSGEERPNQDLWKACAVAQCVATAFVRTFTGRDIRPQIFKGA